MMWPSRDAPGVARQDTLERRSSDTVTRAGVLEPAALQALRRALLDWYRARGRRLRIRSTRDPWHVLVSEVMAQQTQIGRVDAAWAGFLERFPTPDAMAEATTADVLRAWQGLGYNRRAVALQRAAQAIVEGWGGRVPDTVADLEALPGVGPYTARAVAALAFGRPVGAVDTNVRRVIGRLLGAGPGPSELQAITDELVDRDDPRTWTHALMELGATVCRARTPACSECPARPWCASVDLRPKVGAGTTYPGRVALARSVPFEETSRWLRGRIVAALREEADGAWTALPSSIGLHGPERIVAAVDALEREGLLERRGDGRVRLPSSLP
jgi:A/G-specific adenine glycosylase